MGERAELFDELKVFLSADQPQLAYSEIGSRTGLKECTVKVAVHRLRRRYGELLRAEIAQTVEDPSEVEDEVRYLIAVLGNCVKLIGGTGKFDGATGLLKAWGGIDLGAGQVVGRYTGTVCFKAPSQP